MSEESISVEETNKIRISLGLKPMAVESTPSKTRGRDEPSSDLSLEDTNRIRKSLGLKPIEETSPSTQSAQSQDEDARRNWLEKYELEKRNAEQERIRKRIEQVNEEARRRRRLAEGRGIADDKDEDESTSGWLKKFHQKQRDLQQKRLQEEEELLSKDAKTTKKSYSSKDLQGLRVGHSIEELDNLEHEVVLTLKDASVLDDEEPELVAEELVARLKDLKNQKERIAQKRGYNMYDEEEELEGKIKGILSKYDDEDTGHKFFVLGSKPRPAAVKRRTTNEQQNVPLEVSLNFDDIVGAEATPSSDYEVVKFKKPKKLKSKFNPQYQSTKRKRLADVEDEIIPPGSAVDDDDLQSALLMNRRKVQKDRAKVKNLSPEEMAERLLAKNETGADSDATTNGNGLVISEMTDFLSLLKHQSAREHEEREKSGSIKPDIIESEVSSEVQMDSKMEVDETMEGVMETTNDNTPPVENLAAAIHDETESLTLSSGLGDALKLLQAKGALKKQTEEEKERLRIQQEQREWIRKTEREKILRDLELQKEKARARKEGRFDSLSARERELVAAEENRQRQLQEAKEAEIRFANYKPDIKLRYHDDKGNELSIKEAYKHLSHQFHGTAPGKNKIDKQIKRREEESKRQAQSLFDVENSSGTVEQKKPGVRLL